MFNFLAKNAASQGGHKWKFFRSGGFAQVQLQTADDLRNIATLDQKLWSALSCPVHSIGVGFDMRTLELIDSDKDDRIRAPEIIAAVEFICGHLKDPAYITGCPERLSLDQIDDSKPDGALALAAAKRILTSMGKGDSPDIGIEELADAMKVFAALKLNGDGIIVPFNEDDPERKLLIEQIIATVGGETDLSGEPGVSRAKADEFFAEAQAWLEWWQKGVDGAAEIFPLGPNTPQAAAIVDKLAAKIDDYFTRCRMASFDPASAELMNRSAEDFKLLAAKSLSPSDEVLAGFPLLKISPEKSLSLNDGINPAWEGLVNSFREEVVFPLLNKRDSITLEDWGKIGASFAAYNSYMAEKKGGKVESLGAERLGEILAGNLKERLEELFVADEALKSELESMETVERLVRYSRFLFVLLNNFISLRDFYTGKKKAIFQVGTLYLDGRALELCVKVTDMAKHAALAGLSRTYLAYCDCKRPGTNETMTITAAFTDGDSDRLMVGRNGIFYDRLGRDWDATVVKLIEHPISIRQAFWAPYKKVGRMINQQIEKFASAKEAQVTQESQKAVEAAGSVGAGQAPPQPFDVAKFAGIFAAIGLAVGAIGTAVASVVTGFMGLTWWKMPLALAGLLLMVSGPSMIIAAMNLRNRSLAPLLDANGWAVNTRAKLNINFGKSLTALAKLPEKADSSVIDPFAEKSYTAYYWLALAAASACAFAAWKFRLIEGLLVIFN